MRQVFLAHLDVCADTARKSWIVIDQQGNFCAGSYRTRAEAEKRAAHMQKCEDWAMGVAA